MAIAVLVEQGGRGGEAAAPHRRRADDSGLDARRGPAPIDAGTAEPGAGSTRAGPAEAREPRPLIERIGLAAIAVVLAVLFGGVAVAAWLGGELFLAVMGAIGCLMTVVGRRRDPVRG